MASLWVKIQFADGISGGEPFDIYPIPRNVSALRTVVKAEMAPSLDYLASNELIIFPPSTENVGSSERYESDFSNFPETTSKAPLVVVAPVAKEAKHTEGRSLCCYSSFLLSLLGLAILAWSLCLLLGDVISDLIFCVDFHDQ